MKALKGPHWCLHPTLQSAEVVEDVLRAFGVSFISGPAVLEVHYPEEKLLTQAFSCFPFYIIYNKMNNNYNDLTPKAGLHPIRHKDSMNS